MLKLTTSDQRMSREQLDQILVDPSTEDPWLGGHEPPDQIDYRVFSDGSIAYLVRWTHRPGDATKHTGNWHTRYWDAAHDHWPVFEGCWFRWPEWNHREY